ncbi:MAG TPA: fimbrial biogenesis outer membrane usher protein, partial [Rhodospirillales bacterium]|nr:fimbrial biogenesis outer membrane usher protein [Rhodospirillales bacterium]
DEDEGTGVLGELDYEYIGRRFSVSARTRYADRDFRQFGDTGGTRRSDQLALGLQLGSFGHLGLLLVNQELYDAEDTLTVNGNYSLRLGPGSLIVNAARLFEPDEELAVTVTYSLPLSGNRSLSTRFETTDRRTRGRAQFRQARGSTDLGLDYRIAGELGDDPRYVDARAGYQGRYGALNGDLEVQDGEVNGRLGVDGSLTLIDGRVAATRRIGRAFGLVELPGFPGVRVYLENREVGRTDDDGLLLIPGLRPYEVNRLRIELADLPLGAVVTRGEVETVPYDRAGIRIPFEVRLEARALARLVGPSGEPLPAGLQLADREGRMSALVGRDGLAEITGQPPEAGTDLLGRAGDVLYRCPIPGYDSQNLLADLGERRCIRD